MASQRTLNSPWPLETPAPSTSYTHSKLRRKRDISVNRRHESSLTSRQTADSSTIADARERCQVYSGNNIISCFPTSGLIVSQHQFAAFVWNSRRPELTQTNLVDIFVFHGDSLQPFIHYRNVNNPTDQAGYITAPVNDTWFGTRGQLWDGQNITMPFYWVIIRSDQTLDGSEIPQSTFTAVQTTYLDSVTSSMASSSSVAAASMSSMAAISLSSVASVHNASPSGDSVQQANASSNFPHWAIAVIVVLGFLAIVAGCIIAFLIARRLRRRDQSSNRSSIGSASPMMANVHRSSPRPSGAGLTAASAAGGPTSASDHHHYRASSVLIPDGTSSISHVGSAGEGGPFSGADAAIMADAFRKALRKPDFDGSPVEEGDSPDSQQANTGELMSRELAEEGRDIRSVESSRGVQVETLSDTGETALDH